MDSSNRTDDYLGRIKTAIDTIDRKQVRRLADALLKHYKDGSAIFIFGNGGSGATASHVACDFNKSVSAGLEKKFKFICLNDNMPSVLAYANDISYEEIFCGQLENFLTPKDLVIAISGSGNSKNVVRAIEYARLEKAEAFTLCGFDGGKLKTIDSANCVHIPVNDMQIAEDCHSIVFHMLMQTVCKELHK